LPGRAGYCDNQSSNQRSALQASLARSRRHGEPAKILITRWMDAQGERVPPGTPGPPMTSIVVSAAPRRSRAGRHRCSGRCCGPWRSIPARRGRWRRPGEPRARGRQGP